MTDVPSLGGAQIMGTVGINYMPAIASSMKCVTALEAVNAALRNTQAVARQHGAVFANDLAKQVSNQGIIYDRYGGVLAQVGAKTKTVTQEVKKHSQSVRELAESQTFLQHRMGWFVSGAAFYGTGELFKQTLKTIGDVEMGMVELARISDDVTADFKQMRTELLQLGIDYGRSWTDTQDIALRWAQAGYSVADTLELTKTSLLALNTAELDATNATQSMIGIMAQWNLEAKDLLPVIDKINKTADDYSVSSQDLVDGLLRSSGAAKVMGMSLEENIAVLTAMREATGRTGREIGNAWNSILSYMQRPSAIKVFKSLGIPMFTDQTETQFRPVMQIFTEITQKWGTASNEIKDGFVAAAQEAGLFSEELAIATVGTEGLAEITETANKTTQDYMNTLTDVEKRDAAQAASGIYRRNYLIALIERFAMTQGVLNNMIDASGYSMRENDRTMEALESKVQQLKTAFTMLATEIGEAGLLEMSKAAVDEVRGWVEGFEKLPPELKKIIINLGGTAAAFGVVNLAAKTFFDASVTKGIEKGVISLAAMTVGLNKAEKATLSFGAALKLLATNPIVLAITGLTALVVAVKAYQNWQEKATERAGEYARKSMEIAEKAQAQADKIQKLHSEYETLANNVNRSTEEEERFKKVTDDLVVVLPSAAKGFTDMGEAIVTIESASKAARIELEKLSEEAKRSISMGADAAREQLPDLVKKIAEKEELANKIWAAYKSDTPGREYLKLRGVTFLPEKETEEGMKKAKQTLRKWHDEVLKELNEANKVKAELDKSLQMEYQLNPDPWYRTNPLSNPAVAKEGAPVAKGGIVESATQAYERLNAERAKLNHQMKVGEISTAQYLASLQRIERDMRAAGVEEQKIWAIQEEIASLGGKSSKAYQKSLEEQEREVKQFYDTAFSDAMSYYRHINSLAGASVNEQIQYLRELSQAHSWEKAKMWTLEEEIFRLYEGELRKQQDKFEQAYKDRIKAIEDERDLKIKSIQEQLDALDKEKQGDSRTEAERQHNQKMAGLLEQKQYHELRTGAEHKKAIVDIERQMQEESRDWERQIDDWRREDRKEVLQQQIEDIKKKADEEKEVWKQKYEEIKANWDEWADNFAEAAINDPQWLQIGMAIGDQLASGFSLGIDEMERYMDSVGGSAKDAKSKSGYGGYGGGSPAGYDVTNPNFQYLEQTWAGGALAYIEAQRERYRKARQQGDSDLMRRLEADAARVGYTFDQGGLAFGKGIMFKDTIKPERVLPPQLTVSFDRLAAVLERNPIPSTGVQARGDIIFNAPLFNAQQVEFEDSQDMEIFGREMKRHIESIRR